MVQIEWFFRKNYDYPRGDLGYINVTFLKFHGQRRALQLVLNKLYVFYFRAEIEIEEWGVHGKGETSKVGILRQRFFEVDHPFLYFIWDYFTGTILLIGRVERPLVL